MAGIAFNPQILLNPASVAEFLSGQEQASEITCSRPASNPTAPHREKRLCCTRIDTDEYRYYSYLFSNFILTVASYLLYAACLPSLSKKVWVMSRHAMANATTIKVHKVFQEKLLSRSINTHREDTSDYYLQHPLRIPFITHPTPTSLNFFHEEGLCRGMCHWFIFLYFKTEARFTDPDRHVRAVGEQFEKGAARQPAFLHSLTLTPLYDLLKLNVHQDNSRISVVGKTMEQILCEFQCRIPGVYGIYISSHQVVYIKVDDAHQYLFDPQTGCIKIGSLELFKNAMKHYLESHDKTKDVFIDKYSSRSNPR